MNYKITKYKKFSDKRGNLIVFLKQSELNEEKKKFGQIYFVTFEKKGVIRGNHYHKKWYEWFGIIAGRLKVILEDIETKERKEFILDAKKDKYTRLEIGPNIIHAFVSLTEYAALLNYADSEWYVDDTFFHKIK